MRSKTANTVVNLGRMWAFSRTGQKSLLPKEITPYASSIKLTENCNSKCITCNYWHDRSVDRISTDKAIQIIGQLENIGIDRLRFTGGETLLRRDFFTILAAIKDCRFSKVTIATNGILLNKYAQEINHSCLSDLGVSLDGLEETNDKIRGIKGHYKMVRESLKKVTGKRITIMTTLNHNSYREIPKLLDICDENGFLWDYNLPDDRIYFLKNTQTQSIWPDRGSVDKLMEAINNNIGRKCLARVSNIQLKYTYKYLKREPLKDPPCFMGYMQLFINSQGDVFPGCFFFDPVGNVLESSLLEIINSEAYSRNVKDLIIERKCDGCTCGYGMNEIIDKLPLFSVYQARKKLKL